MAVLRSLLRSSSSFGLGLLLVATATEPAAAELVTQIRDLSGGMDAVAVAPFDPALGTLDRVLVRIEGSLAQPVVVTANTAPHQITALQRFFGLGSRGFSFPADAEILFGGSEAAPAPPAPLRYDLVFDAASDLVGFAVPAASGPFLSLPPSVVGTRASFEALPLPGDPGIEIDMLVQRGRVLSGMPQLLAPSFAGSLAVQYVYTPPIASPPLDSSLVLLADTSATETLSVKAFAADGSEALVVFEAGDVRMPVVLGGLWSDADGSVPVVHEDDASGEDAASVRRLARDGSAEIVAALGGASGNPALFEPRDTVLLRERALVIADAGPSAEAGVRDGKLLRVALATGEVSAIPVALRNPSALALSETDALFVADVAEDASAVLLSVGPLGGTLVELSRNELLGPALDLLLAPDGKLLWLSAPDATGATLHRVDPATGVQTLLAERIEGARGIYLRGNRDLGQVVLPRVGIVALSVDGLDAGSDEIARFEADYYVEEIDFEFGKEGSALAGGSQSPTSPPMTACNDGADSDGDGAVDLADPGCAASTDRSERPDCEDGLDNDGDRAFDAEDRGCESTLDPSEQPACSDAFDGDGDGAADFPADPGCATADSESEDPACDNRVDDDGDGAIDGADPDCLAAADEHEAGAVCANGADDDGDGATDFPADPGCRSAEGQNEAPPCDDGVDNDGDGRVDGFDDDCHRPGSSLEDTSCQDSTDNDDDGLVDFGILGAMSCDDYLDCTGESASCDEVCFGGPRDGQLCSGPAECRVDCVDHVCEEAVIPSLCELDVDCPGGSCNSLNHCAAGGDPVAADPDCRATGSELAVGVQGFCGLGGELAVLLWLLRRRAL